MASPVTQDEKDRFISVLRDTGSISYSAAAIGRARQTMTRLRDADPDFGEVWAETEEALADDLEMHARTRAIDGVVVKRQFDRHGNVIVEEKRTSDALLMFLLKGRRREVFGDTSKLDLSSTDGTMSPAMGETEQAARIASFLALADARKNALETSPDDGSDLV